MDLVYIAVIPAEPLYSVLRTRMEGYSELLESSKALRNPPHITLAPPFVTKDYDKLLANLRIAATQLHPFTVELEGLHAFGDKVLSYRVRSDYIRIVHDTVLDVVAMHHEQRPGKKIFNPRLSKRKKELLARYGETHVKEFYRPHMTLAKSDLNREKLQELLASPVETQHYFFDAQAIQVLRMTPDGWIVDAEIPLTQEEL
jgi:2'-5' RNA ligase